jgi:hypothetical protein
MGWGRIWGRESLVLDKSLSTLWAYLSMEGDLLSDEEELREQSEDLDLNQHRYIKRANINILDLKEFKS